jgi:hypothetical protein
MRAPTVEALTPLPRASIANWFFHASKPAAVLPHCAALALLAINASATKAATVTALNCLQLRHNMKHLLIAATLRRAYGDFPRTAHSRQKFLKRGGDSSVLPSKPI